MARWAILAELAYGTVVNLVRDASQKAQMIHNAFVEQVETIAITADELWSFIQKNKNTVCLGSLRWATAGLALSQAKDSGLILASRVGKHTDELIAELVATTEGKTDCQAWDTDGWGGYERVLPPEVQHHIGKDHTQRLERTNGILRQQIGRWHRQQNKFGKQWEQTKVTTRLVVSYFNWMWEHSRLGTTAAQRAGLALESWSWHAFATFPTLL